MLELKHVVDEVPVHVEFPFYVPINIEFEPCKTYLIGKTSSKMNLISARTLYFEMSYSGKYLLEIGLDNKTGEIRSITLVLPPQIKRGWIEKFIDENNIENNIRCGLPIFKVKQWRNPASRVLVDIDYEVYLETDSLFFIFSYEPIEFLVINNRIVFGFDDDNQLCSIQVRNINEKEMAQLKESLVHIKKLDPE